MHIRLKPLMVSIGFAAVALLASTNLASAHGIPDPGSPTPITINGTITNHGVPVPGFGVVAWCGGLDNFGGWSPTDAHGFFEIHTVNSETCPLGAFGFLEIFNRDNETVAFADATIHTHTTVNVHLEDHNRVPVPEFGWLGGAASLATGVGAIIVARRRFAHPASL